MGRGFAMILDKGGTWTELLFGLAPAWVLVLLVLVVGQRLRLRALVRGAGAGRVGAGGHAGQRLGGPAATRRLKAAAGRCYPPPR